MSFDRMCNKWKCRYMAQNTRPYEFFLRENTRSYEWYSVLAIIYKLYLIGGVSWLWFENECLWGKKWMHLGLAYVMVYTWENVVWGYSCHAHCRGPWSQVIATTTNPCLIHNPFRSIECLKHEILKKKKSWVNKFLVLINISNIHFRSHKKCDIFSPYKKFK